MARVFISYAHEDRALASDLAVALQERGHDVWWDIELKAGDSFRREIQSALDRAAAVLVIWSAISVNKLFVADEANAALQAHKLIPVTFEANIVPPLGFGEIQIADLRGWNRSATAPEIDILDRVIEGVVHGRALEALTNLGGGLFRRAVVGNDAVRALFSLGMTIGGLPTGRLLIGTLQAAVVTSVVLFLGDLVDAGANNTSYIEAALRIVGLFLSSRIAAQFLALAKGRSSRQVFDAPFSYWILMSLIIGVMYGAGKYILIAVIDQSEVAFGSLLQSGFIAAANVLCVLYLVRFSLSVIGILLRRT